MPVILNIETSNTVCSVALTAEGMILRHLESSEGRNHAATLSDFIKSMLDFAAEKEIKLDAVAVSIGPGSYTGLRIGLSEAKGIAYGLDIPVIGISTLQLMATHILFNAPSLPDDVILVPMLDARRMEVYTAAYDLSLRPLMQPQALILNTPENPYRDILASGRPVVFFGNGMPKWRQFLHQDCTDGLDKDLSPHISFIDGVEPLAVDMLALAERAHANRDFIDTAYSTPQYLKDFQATTPRNRLKSPQS